MSFKKNMTRADYIYLDIITKMDEISDLIEEARKNNAVAPINITRKKIVGGGITDPEIKAAIDKKETEIKILINLAALTLRVDTKGQIQTITDVNKSPEIYNWLYLTNKANNETLAAFNIKKTLQAYGLKEDPSFIESIALVHFGIKEPWELVQKYTKGLLKDQESINKVHEMESKIPQIKSLVERLSKQNDCLVSVNNCLEQYLGRKTKIKSLKDIPVDVIDWMEYRTTLPEAYFTNSLPEDKKNTAKSIATLIDLNKPKRR